MSTENLITKSLPTQRKKAQTGGLLMGLKTMRWSKPKPTVGNRIEIHTEDKKFCITKEDDEYTAMKARGALWVVIGKFATLDKAKQIVDEHYSMMLNISRGDYAS